MTTALTIRPLTPESLARARRCCSARRVPATAAGACMWRIGSVYATQPREKNKATFRAMRKARTAAPESSRLRRRYGRRLVPTDAARRVAGASTARASPGASTMRRYGRCPAFYARQRSSRQRRHGGADRCPASESGDAVPARRRSKPIPGTPTRSAASATIYTGTAGYLRTRGLQGRRPSRRPSSHHAPRSEDGAKEDTMKFLDVAKVYIRVRQRRERLRRVPAREVHRIWRALWRQWRQGRRRLGRGGRESQHADRLPLSAACRAPRTAKAAWARR